MEELLRKVGRQVGRQASHKKQCGGLTHVCDVCMYVCMYDIQVDADFLAMIKEAEDDESKASESMSVGGGAEGKY